MCRYGFHNYRDHFACFRCRKAFKPLQREGREQRVEIGQARPLRVPRELVCPDCSHPMVDMGLDFKAPPRSDREMWQILEILHTHGFHFGGCGCGGVGFVPPRRLFEVPAWLDQHRRLSPGEALSRKFATREAGA